MASSKNSTGMYRAIALCRVSSLEQLENNSLNRQRDAVITAANDLNVDIPPEYWWSGQTSSKRGTNLKRKDLRWAIALCKKDKSIRYVIVDEPDRFMRSIDEAAFFEVTFKQLGVTVWYASDPELNKGDLSAKLLKFTKYLSAEGSNEERQRKSVAGQNKALADGRYPFSPKPGYMRGSEKGVQEIHPVRGPALRTVLIRLAKSQVTLTEALIELNQSDFMKNHAPYKMDKFRRIVIDPFYAGVVQIDKQVRFRNENGLHEKLITRQQHNEILRIVAGKPKNQSGPRKNGNPKYPCNNLITCTQCIDKSNGRVVGFDHGNGKPNSKVYEKYRCRSCKRYINRQDLHDEVTRQFKEHPITKQGLIDLRKALDTVWRQREEEDKIEAKSIRLRIQHLEVKIEEQVEAATDLENAAIKKDILSIIVKKRDEIIKLQQQLNKLQAQADNDKKQFIQFAFDFIDHMGVKFLEISPANRQRCKQIVFPAGFYWNEKNKVYTPEVSLLITLATKKKDAEAPLNSHLVRVKGL